MAGKCSIQPYWVPYKKKKCCEESCWMTLQDGNTNGGLNRGIKSMLGLLGKNHITFICEGRTRDTNISCNFVSKKQPNQKIVRRTAKNPTTNWKMGKRLEFLQGRYPQYFTLEWHLEFWWLFLTPVLNNWLSTRVLHEHWTYGFRAEALMAEGTLPGLHCLWEQPGNGEPMCFSLFPGLISGLRGTSYHGNLWIPKPFPVHHSVNGIHSPWETNFWFLLDVLARGQLCTILLRLTSAGPRGQPLGYVTATLGNKPGRGWFSSALELFLADGFLCDRVRQTSGICATWGSMGVIISLSINLICRNFKQIS